MWSNFHQSSDFTTSMNQSGKTTAGYLFGLPLGDDWLCMYHIREILYLRRRFEPCGYDQSCVWFCFDGLANAFFTCCRLAGTCVALLSSEFCWYARIVADACDVHPFTLLLVDSYLVFLDNFRVIVALFRPSVLVVALYTKQANYESTVCSS